MHADRHGEDSLDDQDLDDQLDALVLKAALVWLSRDGQAAMAALRQPGETLDALFNRALITLQRLTQTGTSPDTRTGDRVGAALVALLQVLLPEGERRYLRDAAS